MPIMYSSEDRKIAKPLPMNLFRTHQKAPALTAGRANELDLVRRIAGKDECALQQLYAIHGRGLYAYALRLTGDAAQAEDMVQAVLVAVWQTSGRYRGEGRSIREEWRKLTAAHRAVLELVFYLGLGLEETAEVSGCPVRMPQAAAWHVWTLTCSGAAHYHNAQEVQHGLEDGYVWLMKNIGHGVKNLA